MMSVTYLDKGAVLSFLAHGMLQLSSHCYVVGDLFCRIVIKRVPASPKFSGPQEETVLRSQRALLLLAHPGILALIFQLADQDKKICNCDRRYQTVCTKPGTPVGLTGWLQTIFAPDNILHSPILTNKTPKIRFLVMSKFLSNGLDLNQQRWVYRACYSLATDKIMAITKEASVWTALM